MRKTRVIFCLSLFLVFVSALSSCSGSSDLNNAEKKKIALIVKMNSGYHWATVKQGADTAAREFNVNVDFNAPDDEEDVKGQIDLVNQAIEKKVDALILAASDYKALVDVTEKAYSQHIPVIIIDSEVATDKINSYIATNNLDAGYKAGKELISMAGENCRVVVMNSVMGSRNAEQREEGLMSFLVKHPGVEIADRKYCASDTKLASQTAKSLITGDRDLNAFIAFNSAASEGVAEAIDQMQLSGRIKVISFDSTPNEIDYLDKGVIQATITENPFSMGYLGVKYAVDVINGKSIPRCIYTESKIIEKSNMYLPENQKLLFPFVK